MGQFKTKLFLLMGCFSLLIITAITYADQKRFTNRLLEDAKLHRSLVQDTIMTAVADVDKAYSLMDADLERTMEQISYSLREKYDENPDFESWDFGQLKQEYSGIDIYIINEKNVIAHSSYEVDIGLDFDHTAPDFSNYLNRVRTSGTFVADLVDAEQRTGKIRKYSYIATPDQKYIIELGVQLTGNRLFELFSFVEVAERLENKYSDVERITVYTADGKALGKTDSDGKALALDASFADVLKQVKQTMQPASLTRTENGRQIEYMFIPYVREGGEHAESYTNFRLIEIAYNNDLRQEVTAENRKIFILQLLIVFGASLVIASIIVKLVATPMYFAAHDPLTGLANRVAFERKFNQCSSKVCKSGGLMALILVDIDHFKEVNDSLGHDGGDDLLKKIGETIRSSIRSSDLAARMGGDEFAVMLKPIQNPAQAAAIAENMINAFRQPIIVKGRDVVEQFKVTASLGVALVPDHGTDFLTVYKHADLALYRAKHSGKNHYVIFDHTMAE